MSLFFVPTKRGWLIERLDEDDAVVDRQGPFETLEEAYEASKSPSEEPGYVYTGSFETSDSCPPTYAPE